MPYRKASCLFLLTALVSLLVPAVIGREVPYGASAAFAEHENGCEDEGASEASGIGTPTGLEEDPETESEKIDEAQNGPPRASKEHIDQTRKDFPQVRRQFWKNEAATNPGNYSPSDVARMQNGDPPIGGDGFPMELHHKLPIEWWGTNDPSNLEPMSRTDHRLGENYRKNHPNHCPGITPKAQVASGGTANHHVVAPRNPSQATTLQFHTGDGTYFTRTISQGPGFATFDFSHTFSGTGTYAQTAKVLETSASAASTTSRLGELPRVSASTVSPCCRDDHVYFGGVVDIEAIGLAPSEYYDVLYVSWDGHAGYSPSRYFPVRTVISTNRSCRRRTCTTEIAGQ